MSDIAAGHAQGDVLPARRRLLGLAFLVAIALAVAIPVWASTQRNSDWSPFTMVYRIGGFTSVGELSSVRRLVWWNNGHWREEILQHVAPGSVAPAGGFSVGAVYEFKDGYLNTYDSNGQLVGSSWFEHGTSAGSRFIGPGAIEMARAEGLRDVPAPSPDRIKLAKELFPRPCVKDPSGRPFPGCNPNDRVTTEMVFTSDRNVVLSRTVKVNDELVEYLEVLEFTWGAP